jgi:hypothetical protein
MLKLLERKIYVGYMKKFEEMWPITAKGAGKELG